MPFGFPAYQEESVRFRGVSREQLARAAEDALDELGWHPRRRGKWRLEASVPMGFHVIFVTFGARFMVEADEERLHLRSEGAMPLAWMDLGQHSENIRRFLDRVDDL